MTGLQRCCINDGWDGQTVDLITAILRNKRIEFVAFSKTYSRDEIRKGGRLREAPFGPATVSGEVRN